MSAYKFGLFFRAPEATDSLRGPPIAHVYVKSYLQAEYSGDPLLITTDCVTRVEAGVRMVS